MGRSEQASWTDYTFMGIQVIEKCTNDTKGMQSAKFRQWESSNRTTQVTSTKKLQEEKNKREMLKEIYRLKERRQIKQSPYMNIILIQNEVNKV